MSKFHEIIAQSFTNREISDLRRSVLNWYYIELWDVNPDNVAFAHMWRTGQFDALEAFCEELMNGST